MRKMKIAVAVIMILCMAAFVSANVLMRVPAGTTSVILKDGTMLVPDANRNISVPYANVFDAMSAGIYPAATSGNQYAAISQSTGTISVGYVTDADYNVISINTASTSAVTLNIPAAATVAAKRIANNGSNYWRTRIISAPTSTGTITLSSGDAAVSISGTATIAQSKYRDFVMSFQTPTLYIYNVGGGDL